MSANTGPNEVENSATFLFSKAPAPTSGNDDNYVAWARYVRVDDDQTRIVLCNSNVEGAFKVYRRPPTMPTSGNDEVDDIWNRLITAASCLPSDAVRVPPGYKLLLDAAALLRKQAAQIAELQAKAQVQYGELIGGDDRRDAERWRWWLQHLKVEHDSDSFWTRWVAIPMICFRTKTESVNELTDALIERFPIDAAIAGKEATAQTSADQTPATLEVAPKAQTP